MYRLRRWRQRHKGGRQRALVISEGCWLTAGRYQSWQGRGAQRIWMKQQQNGFASPSLSLPLRMAEWEWLRKYVSAYSRRHCIIYSEKHKQSWTNCLKRKIWFFCIHLSIRLYAQTHFSLLPAAKKASFPLQLLPSLAKWSDIRILRQWAHFTQFKAWQVKRQEEHQLKA